MEQKKVYLDNSATTSVAPEVTQAMQPDLTALFGNASSFHSFGRAAQEVFDASRAQMASLLNAENDEIIFTGCGTESDNTAIFGILNAYGKKGHIITSKIEHHAVLYTCRHLQALGYEITWLDVDKDGKVSAEDVKKAVKDNTALVTVMHANNEVGTFQPIEKIGVILREINKSRKDKIYFHTDAVQTAGKINIDVKKLGVDLLSVSAHKFHGPKGVGALYVRKGTHIAPLMYGGHHEFGIRPGTENIPFIAGIAKALEFVSSNISEYDKKMLALREKLKKGIVAKIPEVIVNGSGENAMSGILNISFNYIEGEALLLMLDMKGIAASTGSACASGSSEPSHVLSAMCVDPVAAQGTIRFSFSHLNTDEDVDYVLEVLPAIVENLRAMSPVWKSRKK